ncbi:hypothetical protein IAE35_05010 [Pseudomonas sp. S75]|uniref:hypothetical protein n=1 Tax=unclassified Pseudomonas TaxID=196821 RepID=UPI001904289A|nr:MULTISPECIES: hypothetical protein [unclassified Pseudomonas]MBJ9975335.1 hypothetical protein [Pseudomonas sp. S30]MBK0152691.1 hypothetical protein [Pseudomonas sp. S75]
MIIVIRFSPACDKMTAKSGFHRCLRAFDNLDLFGECVRTQIKRAYELSVCLFSSLVQNPDYRADGCAWRGFVRNPTASVRRVQFSFHIVEIS